jgi:hypothetical protein
LKKGSSTAAAEESKSEGDLQGAILALLIITLLGVIAVGIVLHLRTKKGEGKQTELTQPATNGKG